MSYGGPLGPRPNSKKNANKLNSTGLGRSLVNERKNTKKTAGHSDRYTTEANAPNWVKLQSVTQERALDEFLSTAELADKDFTTERTANIRIIQIGGHDVAESSSGVLSDEQRARLVKRHYENAGRLTVPRRPKWTKEMSAHELDRLEKEAFLSWRRSLADLQENNDLLLTPFERNIEVWRQLWRVVDRSDLVVQIVDSRNPTLFRSIDLDNYVGEVGDGSKRTLLLVNKADLLSEKQLELWADYFREHGIQFAFFSARAALDKQEADELKGTMEEAEEVASEVPLNTTQVLSVAELESLFKTAAPNTDKQLQIGLVGYPNVGKSSTINALIGAKKVSVSSTPGKTKHFQTIKLSDEVMLCDCPGLVFPNFAQTSGDLVCNGVLPIDQLREYSGPVELVCQRIPLYFLEAVYGIHIFVRPKEEGGTGIPTAQELLSAYAKARGFMRQGGGDPDVSRAARIILKDYVNAKLLYCEPPPNYTGSDYNAGKYGLDALQTARRNQILDAIKAAHTGETLKVSEIDLAKEMQGLKFSSFDSTATASGRSRAKMQPTTMGDELDRNFFLASESQAITSVPFHLQNQIGSSKKHFKGKKKGGK
ncbi:Large subunit GTPase 1 [Wickerhamiella sorbophila]|uniref:Large subunit GTPase 1 n=1 Tax=Wickerhamiella sorbophila TaxID=45607 RepID=A0A2T0FQ26_9ASCO|nr:Large subunit GTPase 1 [Wickerhamiella sorbophila]PRT57059.1 Large subunit GTPase 1 [Wickerhamiella sorbophila]